MVRRHSPANEEHWHVQHVVYVALKAEVFVEHERDDTSPTRMSDSAFAGRQNHDVMTMQTLGIFDKIAGAEGVTR